METRSLIATVVCFAGAVTIPVSAQTIVGIVADGPDGTERRRVSIPAIEEELENVIGGDFDIFFPDQKRLNGGWSLDGVRQAIARQLEDPEVDILITTGVVASNEVARIDNLSKPVIAAVTADTELQEMPLDNETGTSGKDNLVYLSNFRTIDAELLTFFDAVRFEHLAVLIDELTLRSIPRLPEAKARQLEEQLGIRISLISVTDSADNSIDALPEDADAVYVTPLLRFDDREMTRLADLLIDRRVPSFSLLGRDELEYGLLMATGGREEDRVRYTRRMALNLQRILLGQNPSEIEVGFRESSRLTINMQTARAIGFAPSYALLTDAERLYDDELESGEALSLSMAMAEAIEANLDLRIAEIDPLISREGVSLAQSALLPQLGIAVQARRIDADRANPIFQAERSRDAQLTGAQILYSDDDRAQYRLAQYIAAASDFEYQIAVLDTLQSAARSYLNVLRARALESVQRSNLEVTRANLELAIVRESVGFSGRSDVLRWQSQLSTDLQNLIAAEADRRAALTDVNRILHRPQNQNFTAPGDDVAESIAIFQDERFQVFIDNAVVWETFQAFSVDKALDTAPELSQLDELIAAQERLVVSSQRRYYVPELALIGDTGSVLSRSGAGSDVGAFGLDDESWSLSLRASLPVFSGGALRARLNADRYELQQLRNRRLALSEAIEARTRLALHRASGTYPAIEPALDAARSAGENLLLVTDAYSQGVVSVTDLIDAQNAALAADLRAADTQYAALIDVIDVFRSSGDFSLFLDSGSAEAWFQEVEAYFRAAGVEPRR